MKKLLPILLVALLAGCTSVSKSTNISSDLHASEYNHVASQYLSRPTFVRIDRFTDGQAGMAILMDGYGSKRFGVEFGNANLDENIAMIDKYLSWEQKARQRGDIFTKEIGRAKGYANMADVQVKYTFHSGNEHSHYLAITYCAIGSCGDEVQPDQSLYFDRQNAEKLKDLLFKFEHGQLKQLDVDAVYQ